MAKEMVAVKGAEVKAAKKPNPKKEARKANRKAARPRIMAFLQENAEQLGTLANDIRLFVGGGGGGERVKGLLTGTNAQLREALVAAGKAGLSEIAVFKQFHIGRPEMGHKIRSLLKVPDKTARVWVAFSEADETYRVVGTGEAVPKGWDGYIPTEDVKL